MKRYVYLLTLCIYIISCGNTEEKRKGTHIKEEPSLIHIKIDKTDISSLPFLKLSEFVDSIVYLQLETTEKCLLPYDGIGYNHIFQIENSLFLGDIHSIFKFDATTGKFIGNIGHRGQGPKEYIQIQNICIDKDNNRIIVKDQTKRNLIMYNYNGKYLGRINLDNMKEVEYTTCYYSLSLLDIDSQYMIFTAQFMPVSYACQPNEVIVYDYKNQKVVHTLPNLMEGIYKRHSNHMNGMRTDTKCDDKLYHKSFYNDTLYTIHKEKGINPLAVIDLGSKKLPNEVFFLKDGLSKIFGKLLINDIYANDNYIILECFIPHESKKSDYFLCKYNIATQKLTYHQPLLVNDIDGGQNIYLINQLSRKIEYVLPSETIDKEYKDSYFSTLDKTELKYPKLKDRFEYLQKNRNLDDNPLLMILYTK